LVPAIASLAFWAGILGIFWLDRDRGSRASPALWIAVAWFLLACSRSASQWLYPDQAAGASAQVLEGNPLDRAVYTGLLFLGLIVLAGRGGKVVGVLRQIWPILFFFIFCLVSLIWSDYPMVAFKRWNKAIGDLVMVLIVWTDPHPVNALKQLFAKTSYILIPISILLIKYYPALGRTYGRWFGEVHYTGVTTNKNSLGAICLLFGLASVWRLFNLFTEKGKGKQRARHVVAQAVILAMILWLFAIVDSMTSLACFILAVGLLLATHLRLLARNRVLIHYLVLIIVLIPALVVFLGLSQSALQNMGRDPTLTDRTLIWSMVIDLTPNRWIGTGYESFWLGPRLDAMSDVFKWVPNEAHNGYIEIFANLGWTGLACLSVVVFHGYRRTIRAWIQNLPTSSLMLAYFVVGVIYNFTEAGFFKMMAPVWMFFLLAITGIPRAYPVTALQSSEERTNSNQLGLPLPKSGVLWEGLR
jgi:exopolysaccharide production protein ExoQ